MGAFDCDCIENLMGGLEEERKAARHRGADGSALRQDYICGERIMTNEEAIKILEDTAFLAYQNASLDEINEAIRMAVEALRQPEIMSNGTLHITVDVDVSTIDRILLTQKGTHSGDIYYREEEHED